MKAYVGVDPGKAGCIVIQYEDGTTVVKKLPLIGNEIDLVELNSYFESLTKFKTQVVIEDVHAIHMSSAKSTWSFAHTCGILEGLIVANKLPYLKVAPKKWQKLCFEGIKEVRKPDTIKKGKDGKEKVIKGKVDTKSMSILASKRLYPTVSLKATERSKVDDNNISDALLLSHYCKLQYNR